MERIAELAEPTLREDLQDRVASALDISPVLVTVERYETGASGWILFCGGVAAGRRFFAKVFLVDPYPMPPRFATPAEELAVPELPKRPVAAHIVAERNMVQKMRALAGTRNVPVVLGYSVGSRTLVFEEVGGLRMDRFVNWAWPNEHKMRSVQTAMFQAGAWLRTLHDSSLQGYETVDLAGTVAALRELADRRKLDGTPYGERAHDVLESAVDKLRPQTCLRVPVALNHGDFSLPNLIWDDVREQLWVVDFELSSYRPILHDLCTMLFTLWHPLLRPLTLARVVQLLEGPFWQGYGPVPEDIRTLANGLACARLFYHSLPRVSTLRERHGWKGAVKATLYKSLFQRYMIARVLQAQRRDEQRTTE